MRTIILLFFVAFSALFSKGALAAAGLTNTPEMISRVHCTLLLQSLRTIPLSTSILEQRIAGLLSGYSGDPSKQLIYIARMEYLPDFGFILGRRWESMTRDERVRFNRSFALYLGSHYNLRSYTQSDCTMNSTIYGASENKESRSKLPMRAISYTQLVNDNHRIALIYSYDYLPTNGWEMQDIAIQDRSLTAEYRIPLNALIQKGGTAHIERLVQSLND